MSTHCKHEIIFSNDMWVALEETGISINIPDQTTQDIYYLHFDGNNIFYMTKARAASYRQSKEYCNFPIWHKDVQNKYAYKVKPGRLFRQLVPSNLIDKRIEEFVFAWNTYITNLNNVNVTLWPSSKIPFAYLETNYVAGKGMLQGSCMRYARLQPLLKFYIVNGIKIVVLLNMGKIRARALLWPKLYSTHNRAYISMMDRVYYTSENDKNILAKFAADNGFIIRLSTEFFSSKGHKTNSYGDCLYMSDVILDGILCLPYADTMYYLYYRDKILSNSVDKSLLPTMQYASDILVLHTTQDYIEQLDPNIIFEVFTNKRIKSTDAIFSIRYNGHISRENAVFIKNDIIPYHKNDEVICPLQSGEWEFRKNCLQDMSSQNYIRKRDAIIISHIQDCNTYGEPVVTLIKHKPQYITIDKGACHQKINLTNYLWLDSGEILENTLENKQRIERIPQQDSAVKYRIKSPYRKFITFRDKQLVFNFHYTQRYLDKDTSHDCNPETAEYCIYCEYYRRTKDNSLSCMYSWPQSKKTTSKKTTLKESKNEK